MARVPLKAEAIHQPPYNVRCVGAQDGHLNPDPFALRRQSHVARRRDAVRVLQILRHAGAPAKGRGIPADAVQVIRAQKKIMALDFWVRYPDYLANEMLNQFEASDRKDRSLLEKAAAIMADDEPDLRRISMMRGFFGAYEAADDAVATLVSYGFVAVHQVLSKDRSSVRERDYYLLRGGAQKADELAGISPLSWYADRAALVAAVAGTRSGNQLKDEQHKVATYHNARWGDTIGSIRGPVAERIKKLTEEE